MKCSKCGNEVDPSKSFCENCGEPIAKPEERPKTESESTSAQTGEPTMADAQPKQDYQYNMPPVEPVPAKKGKKGLIAALVTVGVLAVAAVVVAMNFSALKGFFVKTFGSDSDYLSHVEENAIDELTENMNNSSKFDYFNGIGMSMEASMDISDTGIELISQIAGGGSTVPDLSWVKDFSAKIDANFKDDKLSEKMSILNSGNSIITLDAIIDLEKSLIYANVPEMSDKYLSADMGSSHAVASSLTTLPQLLPDSKTLGSILSRYVKIVTDNLDNVSSAQGTVEANGVSCKCTALTSNVSQKDAMKIAKAVLNEVKNDDDIMDIIMKLQDTELNNNNSSDLQSDLKKAIESAIENIDSTIESASDETAATIICYVADDEIIGYKVTASETNTEFFYACVEDGDDFGFEFNIDAGSASSSSSSFKTISIIGNGKSDSGKFSLNTDGKEIAVLNVEDFECNDDKSEFKGKFTLELGSDIGSISEDSSVAILVMLQPKLVFNIEAKDQKADFSAIIQSADEPLVTFNVKCEYKDAEELEIPDQSQVETDQSTWQSNLDFTSVMDNLKKSTIPSEYLDIIINALNGTSSSSSSFPGNSINSSYGTY